MIWSRFLLLLFVVFVMATSRRINTAGNKSDLPSKGMSIRFCSTNPRIHKRELQLMY